MSQRITLLQFKEAIHLVSKVFKDLGEQTEVNVLPLLGGVSGAGNIHLALMRMNLLAQQMESDEQRQTQPESKPIIEPEPKQVDAKYKAGTVVL